MTPPPSPEAWKSCSESSGSYKAARVGTPSGAARQLPQRGSQEEGRRGRRPLPSDSGSQPPLKGEVLSEAKRRGQTPSVCLRQTAPPEGEPDPSGAAPQFHLAAFAVCVTRRKGSCRKAARLRKFRLCLFCHWQRKAAIPLSGEPDPSGAARQLPFQGSQTPIGAARHFPRRGKQETRHWKLDTNGV